MAFEDYKQKDSVVIVYTGDNKGKTSASLGLMCRALGTDWKVAYIQFVKSWKVGEHDFIEKIMPLYDSKLTFYKGGKGFYNAGNISAKNISQEEHKQAAQKTFDYALSCASSGDYELVICDEINNAEHDGLLPKGSLKKIIDSRAKKTSLCLTGRNFPEELLSKTDIATSMEKLKHHYDDKFLANEGIDY